MEELKCLSKSHTNMGWPLFKCHFIYMTHPIEHVPSTKGEIQLSALTS